MNPLVGDIQAQQFSFNKKPERQKRYETLQSDRFTEGRYIPTNIARFDGLSTAFWSYSKVNPSIREDNPKVFFFPLNDSKSDTLWNAILQNTRRKSEDYIKFKSKTTLTSPGTCVMRECIFSSYHSCYKGPKARRSATSLF